MVSGETTVGERAGSAISSTWWHRSGSDALCINQGDVEEKNSQVRLMGDIYEKAIYVLSWLEPRDLFQRHNLDLIRRIAKNNTNYTLHEREDIQRLVSHFLNDPYWSRRWTVQEVALARSVVIATPKTDLTAKGADQIPFSFLSSFSEHVKDVQALARSDIETILTSPASGMLSSRTRESGPKGTLRSLLISHKQTQCSDIRDKIFALLGLCRPAWRGFEIDYQIEPVELFFSVFKFTVEYEGLFADDVLGLIPSPADLSPKALALLELFNPPYYFYDHTLCTSI